MFFQYEMGDRTFQKAIPFPKTRQTAVLPFFVESVGDFFCDRSYFTRRQGYETCLLLYTLEGSGIVEYEGERIILSPGMTMVLDCRKYQYYATYTEKWRFVWIHFRGRCAYEYVELLNEEGVVPVQVTGKDTPLHYCEMLKACAEQFNHQKELETSLLMQTLMTSLINKKATDEFSIKYSAYQEELEYSIAYMQDHVSEKISVEELADICHLNKYHYIKVFKAYMGQTPYDYLLNIRLQKAKRSLLETTKCIEEIAQECGYTESKNFIAGFKLKVGITPLQYRKQNITPVSQ